MSGPESHCFEALDSRNCCRSVRPRLVEFCGQPQSCLKCVFVDGVLQGLPETGKRCIGADDGAAETPFPWSGCSDMLLYAVILSDLGK